MKTRITTEGDVTVIELSGYLDFETANPIANSIDEIYKNDKQARVVINMTGLQFVGSSGISSFVKNLRVFNKMKMKPSYFGVRSEFMKIFKVFEEEHPFDVSDTLESARMAALARYEAWQIKTLRSKRTH